MTLLPPRRREHFLYGLLLVGILWALYSASLGHNFLFDEENIVLSNPLIRGIRFIPQLLNQGLFYRPEFAKPQWNQYYRPMTSISFAVDFQFWKGNPLGYNLTNLFLQTAVVLLLYGFLRKVLRLENLPAFLAVFLYAVHPLHTEAVTYIASRSDLFSGIFLLGILWLYHKGRLGWSVGLYALSLFTKESLLILPLVIFLFDACFASDRKMPDRVKRVLIYAVVAGIYLLYRRFVCPVPMGLGDFCLTESLLRFFSMGPAVLSYIRAVAAPESFKFTETVQFTRHFFSQVFWMSAAVYGVWGLCAIFFFLKKRRVALFGWVLSGICFLPYLQGVHFYPEWTEHYLYLPWMGLAIVGADLLNSVYLKAKGRFLALFFALYLPWVGFLCARTWERNLAYADPKRYASLLVSSGSPYAFCGYQMLGLFSIGEGKQEEAEIFFKKAVEAQPRADSGYRLLGTFFEATGKFQKALKCFEITVRLNPNNNSNWLYEARVLRALGRTDEAERVCRGVWVRSPGYLPAYLSLMEINELAGRAEKVQQWAQVGRRQFKEQKLNLAILIMAQAKTAYRAGDDSTVRQRLKELLELCPDVGWYADAARFLLGQITEDSFLKKIESDFQGFDFAVKNLVLTSYVLNGRYEKIAPFLKKNAGELDKAIHTKLLYDREMARAREAQKLAMMSKT